MKYIDLRFICPDGTEKNQLIGALLHKVDEFCFVRQDGSKFKLVRSEGIYDPDGVETVVFFWEAVK